MPRSPSATDDNVPATPSLNSLSDADLLDSWVRDECREALDMLVRRYAVMVASICHRRCRGHADAQDAMQTTFLYLAKSASKIAQPDRLAGWLHRVAQRASVATVNSQRIETEAMIDVPAKPDDPLQRLTQRHEAIVLDEELADLPDRYRSAIVLHLMDDETFASVAERLGTTTGAVRGYVQRGKKLLARRLRHRGVVPVMAFAATQAWTCETDAAMQLASDISEQADSAPTADDAPDFSSLESLLQQGNSLMSVSTKTCLIGLAACAIAVAAIADGIPMPGQSAVLTIPATQSDDGESVALAQGMMKAPSTPEEKQAALEAAGALAGGSRSLAQQPSPAVNSSIVSIPDEPKSETAKKLIGKIDEPLQLDFNCPLERFASQLAESIGAEVFIDSRSINGMQLDSKTLAIQSDSGPASNLRSTLRRSLRPHGLRAVIEEDGLVITTDWAELTSRGISTERWLDVSAESAKQFDDALNKTVTLDYDDLPLEQVADDLSRQGDIPIVIDIRALDELGLSADTTFNTTLRDVPLRTGLQLTLRSEELTYLQQNEVLIITTREAAESRRRSRAYYVEDIVGSQQNADFTNLMMTLQTTVHAGTWEALGGPSTMTPFPAFGRERRSVLIVSTTEEVHNEIKLMLDNLRRSPMSEPPMAQSAPPRPRPSKPRPAVPTNTGDPFGSNPFGTPARAKPDPFGKPSDRPSSDPFGN